MESENFATELSDQDRILIVFDYLGPLALISLVASRREFVKWHAKQGLVLSATVAALYVVMKMIHVFLTRFFWSIFGELFWACAWLTAIGVLVLIILCIVRGLEGERFKVPVLGDLADKL